MSKKPQYDPEEIRFPDQHIVERSLVPEMEKSYIEYAMSVIVDGLQTVPHVGQRPAHDNGHGVFDVGLLHLRHQ